MNVIIRPAKELDFEAVQNLSRDLTVSDSKYDPILVKTWAFTKDGIKYLKKRIEGKNSICIIAELKGEVVGYATCAVVKRISWRLIKRVELENLIVKEGFRDTGIGVKLIDEYFNWGRKMKADRAMVHSYFKNEGAITFYTRNGLKPLSLELEMVL